MGRFGERFGRFDDRTAIYGADDPDQTVHWRPLAGPLASWSSPSSSWWRTSSGDAGATPG